jgi:transcriptional regulator with XRE-family HTH domain
MREELAERIRIERESKNMTRKAMAAELGIRDSTYSNIEKAKASITVERLQIIAKILGLSIIDFFPKEKRTYLVEDPKTAETDEKIRRLEETVNELKRVQYESLRNRKK